MSELREISSPFTQKKDLIDLQKSGRKPILLGRHVKFRRARPYLTDPYFYIPPFDRRQTESIFIHGANRSGKTSLAANIALQSYYLEGRSWIFFDSKGSYNGVWLSNEEERENLHDVFGLEPTGFPTLGTNAQGQQVRLLHVVAPYYYTQTLTPTDIKADAITDNYRIPIPFLNLNLMCEVTAIDATKKYARRYDDVRKRVFAEVSNPNLNDVLAVLQEIIDKTQGNVANYYKDMKRKIDEEGEVSIQPNGVWSPVGRALREAAMDGLPRFIVVTFQHSDSPLDERNQACYSAILDEVRRITTLAKRYPHWKLKVGIIVDEMYYYTRKKEMSSWIATHDLLYRWGGGNWVLRLFCTQRDVQLEKEFSDSITNTKYASTYAYDVIFHTRKVPTVGYASVLDRIHPILPKSNEPQFIDNIKLCPSLCQIEHSGV